MSVQNVKSPLNSRTIDNAIFPIRLYNFKPDTEPIEILKTVDFDAVLKTRAKPTETDISHSISAFTDLLYSPQTHEPDLECTFIKTTIILTNAADLMAKQGMLAGWWSTIRGIVELNDNAIAALKKLWVLGDTNHTLILLKTENIDPYPILEKLKEQRVIVLNKESDQIERIMNWCHLSAMTAYMRVLPI